MPKSNISIYSIDYVSIEEKKQYDLVICTRLTKNRVTLTSTLARNTIYVNRCQNIDYSQYLFAVLFVFY